MSKEKDAWPVKRSPGADFESVHEKRQKDRRDRMRKWRKETRHPRTVDLDEKVSTLLPRRFQP